MATAFADNFARFLKLCGVTQKWIAARLGVTPDTISRWVRGKSVPDAANMAALANLLGVSVDDLLASASDDRTGSVPHGAIPILGRATAGPLAPNPGPSAFGEISSRGPAQTVSLDIQGLRVTIRVEKANEEGGET